jgi:translation initiation factor IF-3
MSHPELGKRILDQVAESVAAVAKVEAAPKLDGRNMIMVLAPDRRSAARKPAANGNRPADTASASNPAGSPTTEAGSASVQPDVEPAPAAVPAAADAAPTQAGTPVPASAPAPANTQAGVGRNSEERTGGAPPIER